MGMHPINFPEFMGFKQKSHTLQEIGGMHAHAWKGDYRTREGGWGNLHFTPDDASFGF